MEITQVNCGRFLSWQVFDQVFSTQIPIALFWNKPRHANRALSDMRGSALEQLSSSSNNKGVVTGTVNVSATQCSHSFNLSVTFVTRGRGGEQNRSVTCS